MRTFVNLAFCCLSMLMVLMTVPAGLCAGPAKQEAELFFNSAVEEYLNENYESALEAVRKSIELDPENEGVKEFAIKLLLQMAANAHLENHHEKAMKLLEEAGSIDPDNERVNKLYLMIRQKPPELEKTAVPVEKSKDMPKKSKEKPRLREPLSAPPKHHAVSLPKDPKIQEPKSKEAVVPVPETPAVPASRVREAPPGPPQAAFFWKVVALVFALTLVLFVAAFIYLKRVQKRLQGFLRRIRKVEKGFGEGNGQMEKVFSEQSMREKETREREKEKARQADMEKQELLRQERQREIEDARAREERERFRLEERQKKEFDRMIKKEQPQSEEAAQQSWQGAKGAKGIHEEMLIIEASSVLRERSYKRLASQFREIYELDKAKALEFIKPLLGDPNPQVRAYVAGGVSQLPVTESVSILFQLWEDPDIKVKAESLRGLHNFYKRPDFTHIFPEKTQAQVKQLVEREKRKGEWLL